MHVRIYVCVGPTTFCFPSFNLLAVVLSRQIWYFWKGLDATSLFQRKESKISKVIVVKTAINKVRDQTLLELCGQ